MGRSGNHKHNIFFFWPKRFATFGRQTQTFCKKRVKNGQPSLGQTDYIYTVQLAKIMNVI